MQTLFMAWSTVAIHHILIGTALLVLLSLFVRARKPSAELQSWLWLTAFILATFYPLALVTKDVLAEQRPNVYAAVGDAPATGSSVTAGGSAAAGGSAPVQSRPLGRSTPEWHLPPHFIFKTNSLLNLCIVIWSLGAIWRLLQLAGSCLRTKYIVGGADLLPAEHPVHRLVDVPILISNRTATPLATGLLRPAIVIPASLLRNLGEQQLIPVVLHELAHIKRRDLWFGVLQELSAVVFWWSPVARWLDRRIHINRELACDIRAARQLPDSKIYAQALVDCAKLMLTRRDNGLAMGLFSRKKALKQRVEQVLDSHLHPKPATVLVVATCLLLAVTTITTAQGYAPRINVAAVEAPPRLSRSQQEQLLSAVTDNDLTAIQGMIADGLDINTPMAGEGTALIVAVRRKNLTLVRALIGLGADVNQAAIGDGNPLITAAMMDSTGIADVLLAHGADIDAVVPYDETPLINAARRGHLAMTRWLVENGADVNLKVETADRDNDEIRSPLNMASTEEIRSFLLAHNATE
ncbi:peptidase M56, BlaR1 [Exilibacterium tricleocarpae]|uniref:Peptidase M56, BlaR1 n=1 Tax=Exilibacterium tricleocarpae TaxID=2591008 RepID=A0A545TAE4_9GAMM|nr:M56 family metallopeptidase [Exilibacterium tricleocarpae]TQV74177.1 peptidase M56, BlaR1 [Exilibacterium tricleocarpae]